MVDGLILLTQVGLLALLLLLAFRMSALVRAEPVNCTSPVYVSEPRTAARGSFGQHSSRPVSDRARLITQLHILAGLQERDCRVNGLELPAAPEVVRAYAAAWLYGAGCALSEKSTRHSGALARVVAQIASRKTGIPQQEALQAISTLTGSTVLLACFRAGLEGAEFWRESQYVPPASSLYEAITANAFI
ncbi:MULTISPECIES: hypothetical protein [Marinobacter]|uniref:Uncharacterized protein n=1 Tax=Marinobacter metalliresistant TaxID=2961995 RepID=A0ABZ2W6Z2_9GAMM|nr:hypothetical protein [Marinobacter sp. Arc7-DN-1]AXS81952.1 hypothetical protein D0851_02175 [Marinobacter sp. Arc7-DN-1]